MAELRRAGWLLPALLILLVLLVAAVSMMAAPRPMAEPIANRSVHNSAPTGYRAWFLASQKSGIPLEVWEHPFQEVRTQLAPGPATMLVVAPFTVAQGSVIFGQREVELLLSWVSRGNTLVLLDDFGRFGSKHLAELLSLEIETVRVEPGQLFSLQRVPGGNPLLGSYVRDPLLTQSDKRFRLPELRRHSPLQPMVVDAEGRAVLIRARYSRGSIILGTATDMASNRFLHGAPNGNYQFLANLLVLERKPVFVNEFVHGYTAIDNIFAYYQRYTPLGLMLLQLFFGFLFLLWLSFVRWAPVPAEEAAPAATEGEAGGLGAFIDSLAGIYYRNRAASLALAPHLAQIEAILQRRHRMRLDEEARLSHLLADLFADYSGKGSDPAALLNALKKARTVVARQETLPSRELVRLSRQLSLIQEGLQYGQR